MSPITGYFWVNLHCGYTWRYLKLIAACLLSRKLFWTPVPATKRGPCSPFFRAATLLLPDNDGPKLQSRAITFARFIDTGERYLSMATREIEFSSQRSADVTLFTSKFISARLIVGSFFTWSQIEARYLSYITSNFHWYNVISLGLIDFISGAPSRVKRTQCERPNAY